MIKSFGKLTLATILAALVVGVPLGASAQDKPATTNAALAAPAKHPSTFRQTTVGAVDKANKTITLDDKAKHTLQVNSESKITLNKKVATFDDVMVGQQVTGSYMKSADGKLVLRTLHANTASAAATK